MAECGESSSSPSGTYEQILLDYYNQHGISYGMSIMLRGAMILFLHLPAMSVWGKY